jgi:tRNA(fMet)-specific endonuclease VapC
MKYVIDTDIIIYYLKSDKNVAKKFASTNPDEMATTIINYTELLFGAYKSSKQEKNLSTIESFFSNNMKIIDFDKKSAAVFSRLKAQLQQQGIPIADMDLIIASICISNGLTLVTNNLRHFQRIRELTIENWSLD